MYIYYMTDVCHCPQHEGVDWGFVHESLDGVILNNLRLWDQLTPSECCWMVPGTVSLLDD